MNSGPLNYKPTLLTIRQPSMPTIPQYTKGQRRASKLRIPGILLVKVTSWVVNGIKIVL